MPKRTRKPKDVNEIAHAMVEMISAGNIPADLPKTHDGKDPLAVLLGRRGGLKGGPARAAKLTKKQLSDSARRAATARWSERKNASA